MSIKETVNDTKTSLLKKLLKSFIGMIPIWEILATFTQELRDQVEATPEKEWYEPIVITLDDVADFLKENNK